MRCTQCETHIFRDKAQSCNDPLCKNVLCSDCFGNMINLNILCEKMICMTCGKLSCSSCLVKCMDCQHEACHACVLWTMSTCDQCTELVCIFCIGEYVAKTVCKQCQRRNKQSKPCIRFCVIYSFFASKKSSSSSNVISFLCVLLVFCSICKHPFSSSSSDISPQS